MKRYGNLYSKIYSMDNLIAAHQNARCGKTYYTEVQQIDANPEKYLTEIQTMLREKTYRTSKYHVFSKIDKKKEREIFALPYYPDRIIQWAVVQVLEPIWMETLISNTFSSLKGRGIHQGLEKLKKDLQQRTKTKYCLKLDIRKFYPSIDHEILKATIRHKIKDPDVLTFLDNVIDSAEGVPIGNYLSQYFGNLYLSAFDHWMKETNHAKYYYRYCDDIVVLGPDKSMLHRLLDKIELYLHEHLKLRVKENWQVFPTFVRGIDFLGYRCFGDYTLLRKSTATAMKRKLARMLKHEELTRHEINVIASYRGWLKWCDGYRLGQKYVDPLMKKKVMKP
jgi:RNA-directed DNA polymerase